MHALCGAAMMACASAPFDRYLAEGRWEDAARVFVADTALMNDEDALYSAGVLYGSPTRPTYEPARARQLFRRLLAQFPGSERRADVMDRVAILEEVMIGREASIKRQALLELEVLELRAALQRLRAAADSVAGQNELARRRMESELREREEQLRALRLELRQLKAIDLKPRGSAGRP